MNTGIMIGGYIGITIGIHPTLLSTSKFYGAEISGCIG